MLPDTLEHKLFEEGRVQQGCANYFWMELLLQPQMKHWGCTVCTYNLPVVGAISSIPNLSTPNMSPIPNIFSTPLKLVK